MTKDQALKMLRGIPEAKANTLTYRIHDPARQPFVGVDAHRHKRLAVAARPRRAVVLHPVPRRVAHDERDAEREGRAVELLGCLQVGAALDPEDAPARGRGGQCPGDGEAVGEGGG